MSNTKNSLILLVDDNPQNLQVLGNTLKEIGYKIAIAQNGRQALSFLQKKTPDMILLDIMMPEMDGFEVSRAIKRNRDTEKIPIIFLTAKADSDSIIKGFECGGVDYITKPFIKEIVFARINVHLRLQQTMAKLEEISITDELTGIYNRRYAFEMIARQIAISKRESKKFVVCYLDIDNLKLINDNFGHIMGDRSIKKMIKVLQNSIREYDLIFRMGGDEFLMLFPNADYSESIHLISRIRKKILEDNRDSIAIDFSFGVCEFDYQHPVSAEDLITMADQKMYSAKTNKKTNHDANQN